jgi:tetratricopeptide (TPR) repeat protein
MPLDSSATCNRDFVANRLPWLVAGGALVLYLVTLNPWLTPTNLAGVANVCGYDWQPMLFQPLLYLITLPLRLLPNAWVPLAMNLLSAVLAAATLGLLARSVALLPHNRLPQQRSLEPSRNGLLTIPLAWVPVVLAPLACALQLTFWQHSITGTGEMVDLLLLAAIIRSLMEYRLDRHPRWLSQGFALSGLAVANSWAFVGFAPLFLAAVVALGGKDLLSLKLVRRLLLWGLAGFAFFLLLPVVQFMFGESELSVLGALRHTAGSYYGMVKSMTRGIRAYPHIGVVVSCGSLLPLLFMSFRWKRYAGGTGWVGELLTTGLIYLAHLLLLLGGLWAVFDLPFSPRRAVARLGVAPPLLTFIFLAGLGLGYYVGFFLLLFSRRQPGRRHATAAQENLQTLGRWAGASLVALVPVLLLLKNYPQIRDFNAPVYREYARLAAAQLPAGPTFVFSDDLVRQTLLRATLDARSDGDNYLLLDSRALPFRPYWNHLHRTYPDRWPARPPGQHEAVIELPPRIDTVLLTHTMRVFASTGQVCYLMPGFGTFFDAVYTEPHGLVYPIKPYPRAVLNPPTMDAAVVAFSEQFWRTNSQSLRELVARQQARVDPDRKSSRQRLFKRLGLQDELPAQTSQAANWLAAMANDMGARLQREGKPQAATWYFQEALRLRPANIPSEFNLVSNTNLLAGRPVPYESPAAIAERYGKRRDWSLVMRESGPFDHPTFCYDFGLVFGQAGFVRQGAQQLDRTRTLAPDFLPAWLRLAAFLNALKMPEHALQVLSEMRRTPAAQPALATNSLEATLLEAEALFQKEDSALADANLRAALDSASAESDALSRIMDLYVRHQHWNAADKLLEDRLARNPQDAHALINQGYLQLKRGAFSNAIPPLDRALAQQLPEPQQAVALLNRAICQLRLDNLEAARKDYEQLLVLTPKSFQVYFGLGEIALRRGATNEVIKYYRGYLTNAPAGLEEAEVVRQRLREFERVAR